MTSANSSTQAAAAATKQILGFYDSIPATNKHAFTTGLVELLSMYPQAVLQRAASPASGLAAFVAYPNLAKFRERLEGWHDEYLEAMQRRAAARPALVDPNRRSPPPLLIPLDTPGRLANIFLPASHPRYAGFVEWSRTADRKWWRFERSSDNQAGIWIPLSEWHQHQAGDTIGASARATVRAAQPARAEDAA